MWWRWALLQSGVALTPRWQPGARRPLAKRSGPSPTSESERRRLDCGETRGVLTPAAHRVGARDRLGEPTGSQAAEGTEEDVPLVLRERRQDVVTDTVEPVSVWRTFRWPTLVTAITRARRSPLDGRRSARPAASSSSTVTTIVVLSSPTSRASSVCVYSPVIAVASTEWARGEMPENSSADVSSVVST